MSNELGPQLSPNDPRKSLSVSAEVVDRDTPQLYEFGPFRLEPAERKLMRGAEMVTLTPKAFDTLLLLVRNSGHLLEKDDLISTLWPDTFVEEGSLSNNIFLLRKVLGEDPAFIETVPKRGYRFVGAVRQLPRAAPLSLEKPLEDHRERPKEVSGKGRHLWRALMFGAVSLAILAVGVTLWMRNSHRPTDRSQWVALTQLPDPVSQPALSADGRMLAFVRGYTPFVRARPGLRQNTSRWAADAVDA